MLLNFNNVYSQMLNRERIVSILNEGHQMDQAPRYIIDSLMRAGENDGNKYYEAILKMNHNDSLNQKTILPLIDSIYELQIYDLDSTSYNTCWEIIQHSPNEVLSKYYDFVNNLLKKGLIPRSSYMAYIDRVEVESSRPQLYGYQFHRFTNGAVTQYPLLKGYKKRWEKMGLEYSENNLIPSEYKANLKDKICIDRKQFAIIGLIENHFSDSDVNNISITINGTNKINIDSNGLFKMVVKKKDLPLVIYFTIAGRSKSFTVEKVQDKSFIMLNCIFSDNTIDIMKE